MKFGPWNAPSAILEAVLIQFGDHFGRIWVPNTDPKTDQNGFKNELKFRRDVGAILGAPGRPGTLRDPSTRLDPT